MSGTGHCAPFAQPAFFNQIALAYLAGKPLTLPAATPTSEYAGSAAG